MKLDKYLFILFLILSSIFTSNLKAENIQHLEPAFWWVGMKNTKLQLMVHAKDVQNTNVSLNYQGVEIIGVEKTNNENYLFINLNIKKNTPPGVFNIVFKKKNRIIYSYKYKLLKREKNSSLRKGFNSSDVVYLIMPDRFSNGDISNDSVEDLSEKADRKNYDGRHGGDIKGIISKLDYLQDLGITAIWNTPLMEDNQQRTSYHQYAITDYYKTDARFGTNADYALLSAECKKRGIKLIMDMVTNHCGLEHWWMKDLPSSDWLHQYDKFTNSNHRKTTIYDPYATQEDIDLNVNGWFDGSMPDLNQKNQLLVNYFIQNNIWWIEYANLSGIRMDTYPYNDAKGMATWAKAIMDEYPNFNIVGETWLSTASEIAYWQKDALNADGYNSYLPCVMDFQLSDAIARAFNQENDNWSDGLIRLYNSLAKDYFYPHPENLFIFAENHDTDRFMTMVKGDFSKYKLMMSFLLTTRGIPQIYYAAEILMDGKKSDGDGLMRKDFPGGWPHDERNAFEESGRTEKENLAFDFTKKLLNWRKANPVIHTGELKHFIPQNNIYVYFRTNKEKTVMVILNNKNEKQKLKLDRFHSYIKNYSTGIDVTTGEKINLKKSYFSINPRQALILELK